MRSTWSWNNSSISNRAVFVCPSSQKKIEDRPTYLALPNIYYVAASRFKYVLDKSIFSPSGPRNLKCDPLAHIHSKRWRACGKAAHFGILETSQHRLNSSSLRTPHGGLPRTYPFFEIRLCRLGDSAIATMKASSSRIVPGGHHALEFLSIFCVLTSRSRDRL